MILNCVPEYYRSKFEDEAHECYLEIERENWYAKNKEYRKQKFIEGCNEIRFYPDECCECKFSEEAMPDSEDDDIPTMICNNWRNCQVYLRNTKEAFPDVPFDEYIKWRKEYVEKLKNGE